MKTKLMRRWLTTKILVRFPSSQRRCQPWSGVLLGHFALERDENVLEAMIELEKKQSEERGSKSTQRSKIIEFRVQKEEDVNCTRLEMEQTCWPRRSKTQVGEDVQRVTNEP